MKIVGHRGARGLAPENTLESMLKAIEHQVDEIEIDVRVTNDNKVILCHDRKLTDPSGGSSVVETSDYDELKTHKPDLTLLSEVFNQVKGKTKFCIDIKPKVAAEPVFKTISHALSDGWHPDDITIASFDTAILKATRRAFPELNLAVNETWSGVRAGLRVRRLAAHRMNIYHRWLWRVYVRPAVNRGIKVYAYTVNSISRAKQLQKYGVSGIITDYPDRFEHSQLRR